MRPQNLVSLKSLKASKPRNLQNHIYRGVHRVDGPKSRVLSRDLLKFYITNSCIGSGRVEKFVSGRSGYEKSDFLIFSGRGRVQNLRMLHTSTTTTTQYSLVAQLAHCH